MKTKPSQVGGKGNTAGRAAQRKTGSVPPGKALFATEVESRENRLAQVRTILETLPDSIRARNRQLARCRELMPDLKFHEDPLFFRVMQAQSFLNLHNEVVEKGLVEKPIVLSVAERGREG